MVSRRASRAAGQRPPARQAKNARVQRFGVPEPGEVEPDRDGRGPPASVGGVQQPPHAACDRRVETRVHRRSRKPSAYGQRRDRQGSFLDGRRDAGRAAPAAVVPLCVDEPAGCPLLRRRDRLGVGQRGEPFEHPRRAVDRVGLVRGSLVPEPEWNPRSAGLLRPRQEPDRALRRALGTAPHPVRQRRPPRRPRPQGVSGQVRAAAVERQRSPAAAERRYAAVGILQVEQPADAGTGGLPVLGVIGVQGVEGEQRPGGVVGVGDPSGQVGPRPTAGGGVRVDVPLAVLLIEQPAAQGRPFAGRESSAPVGQARQRVDAQGRHPGGEVRVDGPIPVGAHRALQKRHAPVHDRVRRFAGSDETHDDEARQRRRLQKAAAARLNRFQPAQCAAACRQAQEARQRIARGALPVAGLPDGDQGGQGVADDR